MLVDAQLENDKQGSFVRRVPTGKLCSQLSHVVRVSGCDDSDFGSTTLMLQIKPGERWHEVRYVLQNSHNWSRRRDAKGSKVIQGLKSIQTDWLKYLHQAQKAIFVLRNVRTWQLRELEGLFGTFVNPVSNEVRIIVQHV